MAKAAKKPTTAGAKKSAKKSTKKSTKTAPPAPSAPAEETPKADGACVIPLQKGATSTAVPLGDIAILKGFNPRSSVGDLKELESSLQAEGVLSALVVRPAVADNKVKEPYVLVAGERRLRALQNIKYSKPVPVIVREDLAGDDLRAKAVAAAENSEDGRSNLNHIELGRVAKELADKGWSPNKIAKEMALHVQKARRVLKLMTDVSKDVQEMVANGQLGMTAALEVAKMPAATRKAIAAELHANMSLTDIKALRKKAEKEVAAKDGDETGAKKTKSGETSKRQPTAWKGSTAKQAEIQRLCYYVASASEAEKKEQDYFELRGAIAYGLWDRGDLAEPLLPDGSEAKGKKVLDAFDKIVERESEIYKAAHPEGEE